MSLTAPFANLFAVTLVSLCIVPLLFFFLFLLLVSVAFSFNGLSAIMQWVYSLLEKLSIFLEYGLTGFDTLGIPFWFNAIDSAAVIPIVVAMVGVLYCLAPRGLPLRGLGLLGVLPLFVADHRLPPLRVTFLDVGQGTAVVVRSPKHTLVYDTGRRFTERFNTGEHIIVPYLRSEGVYWIDTLIVSHNDSDHIGGLSGVLANMPVGRVFSGQAMTLPSVSITTPSHDLCRQGQQWHMDNVEISVLWPSHEHAIPQATKNNNHSCVLSIRYQDYQLLLLGDIEAAVERQLVQAGILPSNIDLMLVPHHGSKTSSTTALVKHLRPRYGVVSAGFRNPYHHPNDKVVRRYQHGGVTLFNTAYSGAIRFSVLDKSPVNGPVSSNKERWFIEQWRKDYRRYWFE